MHQSPGRGQDALAILVVWGVFLCLSLFVEPHNSEAPTHEIAYYAAYNVAVGSLVGFYLFDRAAKDGFALFVLRACSAILFGTLVNEAFMEPFVFGSGPINEARVYYGLTDSLSTCGLFLILRLAERLQAAQRQIRSEPASADARCFFVRIGGETRRIHAPDVLYMEAERDFTRIVCTSGEHFVSESLKSLVGKSAGLGMLRVHRSYAVNLVHVERLTRTEARLGECKVPIGRRYWPIVAESWRVQPVTAATR